MLTKGVVLKSRGDEFVLGLEDGSLFHSHSSNFNYHPEIGDNVLVYGELDGEHVVTLSDFDPRGTFRPRSPEPPSRELSGTDPFLPINKTAYVVAAFLGGIFGVHKFITGRVAQGVLYVFLSFVFGVSFILGCIEGFMALNQPTDEYGRFYPRSLFNF